MLSPVLLVDTRSREAYEFAGQQVLGLLCAGIAQACDDHHGACEIEDWRWYSVGDYLNIEGFATQMDYRLVGVRLQSASRSPEERSVARSTAAPTLASEPWTTTRRLARVTAV